METNAKRVKRRIILAAFVLVFISSLASAVVYVGISKPFACQYDKHKFAVEQKMSAWRNGELSNKDILQELTLYAEKKPSFGENSSREDKKHGSFGGYSTLHYIAMKNITEIRTHQAFDVLSGYVTSSDRGLNANAVWALSDYGDKRMVTALMKLLEIEDERAKNNTSTFLRNRHLLTFNTLSLIDKLIGADAVPLLKNFLASGNRSFTREVEETIFKLENDISKPINVDNHRVEIKNLLQHNNDEITLEYSIVGEIGKPVELCAFAATVLIDGKTAKQTHPSVHRGGYFSRGGISIDGLSPGEHNVTVMITNTDKSDSVVFSIPDNTKRTPEAK